MYLKGTTKKYDSPKGQEEIKMKIEVKKIPSKNALWIFAVTVDGEIKYKTGDAKSIFEYCRRNFGIKLPIETGWQSFSGLHCKDDILKYELD